MHSLCYLLIALASVSHGYCIVAAAHIVRICRYEVFEGDFKLVFRTYLTRSVRFPVFRTEDRISGLSVY